MRRTETRGRRAIPKLDCGHSSARGHATSTLPTVCAARPGRACVIFVSYNRIRNKIKIDGWACEREHNSNLVASHRAFQPFHVANIRLQRYIVAALPLISRPIRAYTTTATMTAAFATQNSTATSSRSSLSAGNEDIGEPPLSPSEQVEIELSQARELPSGFISSLSAWWGSSERASQDSELRLLRCVFLQL